MASPSEQLFCLRWNNHQANFIEVFDQLLENETFADVTLGVDDGVFVRCHRMVLAACSLYFQALFVDVTCPHPIVVLKDVKYKELKEILEYMYTGQVKVAQEHLQDLLKIAEALKVKGLVANQTSTTIPAPARRQHDETISTSTSNVPPQNFESNRPTGNFSPPHSTSSPYYASRKSPTPRNHVAIPMSMWALSQTLPPIPQNSSADLSLLPAQNPSMFTPPAYDNTVETSTNHNRKNKMSNSGPMKNHDTPILRTVLGQGHLDNSTAHNQSDGHDYRSHSNGSANNESDGRRSSMDTPSCHPAHSPSGTDTSIMEEDDKRGPPHFGDDNKSAAGPGQKPEWKRYKQYSRTDISNAIEAVRRGMSALQAARKFRVPSRTLYDKVKKLGITTSRPFRRSSTNSGACFPYGIGGNVNGSIYGTITENENSNLLMDNPASLLETEYDENRDNSRDRGAMMEIPSTSPSPQQQLLLPYTHRPMLNEELPQRTSIDDNEDQVEDLSVSRRTDVRVIMSPGIAIKEEK